MIRKVLNVFYCTVLTALFFNTSVKAQQGFRLPAGVKKATVSFELINNLIIVPLELNGIPLSFILDTGVNKPILFSAGTADSLLIKNAKEIYLRGLGEGNAVKAYYASGNRIKINKIYSNDQDLYMILDEEINLSPSLGIPVHGIIGYDLVKDYIVRINYSNKKIIFYRPGDYTYKKCKKCEDFDLEITKNKPYVNTKITIDENGNEVNAKLLIDSGSSDALWLFKDESKGIKIPEKKFEDFLGKGLSGNIHGKRSKINKFSIGRFAINDVKVSFPDSLGLKHLHNFNDRNGSLGGDILKRFNVILNYPQQKIRLRKNGNFKAPFKFNMSGIELQHDGIRVVKEIEKGIQRFERKNTGNNINIKLIENVEFVVHPAIAIVEVRKDSPADLAGLKEGDVIIYVNGKGTHEYSLQEVNEFLNEKPGKKIRLVIDRQGILLRFDFKLKPVL